MPQGWVVLDFRNPRCPQERAYLLTGLPASPCPCWEGLPSGSWGLALIQVPNPHPGAPGRFLQAASFGLSQGPGALLSYITLSSRGCSGPQTCRFKPCSLKAGAASSLGWGDPFSTQRPWCWAQQLPGNTRVPGPGPALSRPTLSCGPLLAFPLPLVLQPGAGKLAVSLGSPFSFTLHV